MSAVSRIRDSDPERHRRRRRLAVRQVRTALGFRTTVRGRRVRGLDHRSRSRGQPGHKRQSRRGALLGLAGRTAGRQAVTFATGRLGKYGGQEIKLDAEEFLIMREDEVLAVIETG